MPDSGGELGKVYGHVGQREVWSRGTDTVSQCTKARGVIGLGMPRVGCVHRAPLLITGAAPENSSELDVEIVVPVPSQVYERPGLAA